jgi:hypothetical protein
MATIILTSHDGGTYNVNDWALLRIGQKLNSTVNVVGIVICYQFEISLNSCIYAFVSAFLNDPFNCVRFSNFIPYKSYRKKHYFRETEYCTRISTERCFILDVLWSLKSLPFNPVATRLCKVPISVQSSFIAVITHLCPQNFLPSPGLFDGSSSVTIHIRRLQFQHADGRHVQNWMAAVNWSTISAIGSRSCRQPLAISCSQRLSPDYMCI